MLKLASIEDCVEAVMASIAALDMFILTVIEDETGAVIAFIVELDMLRL